jgi:hypothetical protein
MNRPNVLPGRAPRLDAEPPLAPLSLDNISLGRADA